MLELNVEKLETISGGGNVNDCLNGILASAGVLAIAATGPTGWLALTALGSAAGTAGFAIGWSCAALYYNGD
ncbi:bacteriocin [Streptococcus suis]|nr:bacteriocin [Streptococcus suis]